MQAASTPAKDAVSDRYDDNASDSSGYSMLTPPSTSTSECNVEELPSDQQVHAERQIHIAEEPHDPKPVVSDVELKVASGTRHQHGECRTTTKQPHLDYMKAVKIENESANKTTFEKAVDFDEGQNALQSSGDHLALNLELQAQGTCVLSIEGRGQLRISYLPSLKPGLDNETPGHDGVELVAKNHSTETSSKLEDAIEGNSPITSVSRSPDSHPFVEPINAPALPGNRTSLVAHRTELAKARAFQAPVDPEKSECSDTYLNTNRQEALEDLNIMRTRFPTLARLIELERGRITEELTANELYIGCDGSLKIGTKPSTSIPLGPAEQMVVSFSAAMFCVLFCWMILWIRM
jgi:hypothetical protein